MAKVTAIPSCLILGGGGHARVIIECLQANHTEESLAILERDPAMWGQEVLGVPVLGGDEMLPELARDGSTRFLVGLGGVGDNRPRRRLFESGLEHGLKPLTICHPSAVCSPSASLGGGTVVFPAAVVNACARLGANLIVNTGAIVEHDSVVGDHVHLATGSRICAAVRIGDAAHIGAGSTVRQGISIGEGAIVGAGAVVVKDVEPSTVVVGVPARVLKMVDEALCVPPW